MAASDVLFISILLVSVGLGLFVLFFASQTITTAMVSNLTSAGASNASIQAIQDIDNVTNRFDYLFFAVFIGLVLAMIISGYFIGGHPIFMFVYFIIIAISVVVSAVIANVWDSVWQTTNSSGARIFGTTITSFPITNHILSNLPYYIAVVGIIGLLAMFAKPYVGASE